MNTIVFNKETKTIDELYVPLTIIKNGKSAKDKIVVDENIGNIFEVKKKLLIIDTAGMGKSTLAKYMYLKSLEKNFGIPILIELRKLEKDKSILEFISSELCLCKKELSINDIRFIFELGEFIFFLDGYDEIPKEIKDEVTDEIRKFVLEFSKNRYVLTSREDESINMFSDFEKYHIKPLEKKEAYSLIRKYDKNGKISERLIKEIESNDQYEVLEEFLSNPLMVSLLYSSYHYKGIIQYKKHLFYRQVYDALYEGHDITKGSGLIHTKKSKLDVEDFNRLLSIVGYLSIWENRISFDKTDIIKLITKAIEMFGEEIKFSAIDFLDDLLHAVPIFVKEGIEYKWSHKSFAEYYAAYFICFVEKNHEKKIINSIMNSNSNANYHNVLDFCYDMDPKAAKEIITYNLISSYVNYCDKNPIDESNKALLLHRYYMFIDRIRFIKTKGKIEIKDKKGKRVDADALLEAFSIMRTSTEDLVSTFNIVSKNYNVFMFVSRKPEYEVMSLLFDKGIDIFIDVKEKEYTMKFWDKIDVGMYMWGETGNAILNSKEVFKSIVSYIHHKNYTTLSNILCYDKCKELKEKIEMDMSKKVDDIYSFA